jgi:hypothetical protein
LRHQGFRFSNQHLCFYFASSFKFTLVIKCPAERKAPNR